MRFGLCRIRFFHYSNAVIFQSLRKENYRRQWEALLLANGRESKGEVKAFLKENGVFDVAFNGYEFKQLELFDSCDDLLRTLANEVDLEEIQLMTKSIGFSLKERRFLELREQDAKKEWANLLKKRGRSKRPEIKIFLKKRRCC